jgi:hypothetical protein
VGNDRRMDTISKCVDLVVVPPEVPLMEGVFMIRDVCVDCKERGGSARTFYENRVLCRVCLTQRILKEKKR